MKKKILSFLLPLLFVVFIPSTAWSQKTKINQETLGIVERCNKIVIEGFLKRSRGNVIEDISVEDVEKIEFEHIPGSDGFVMLRVRDKDNPQMSSKKCMGFISKNSDLEVDSKYSDEEICYYLHNKTAETYAVIACRKGKILRSEYYLEIGKDNKGKESDLHLITDVAYYENGSTTPSLETPLLVLDDYSVNLFKYFWEVFLEKFK